MPTSNTIAVGIDLGSANARVATYDTNLKHPVVCANHDGHRETKVIWVAVAAAAADLEGDIAAGEIPVTTVEQLKGFYEERLLGLASSSAHSKDLSVVTSIPNDSAAAAVAADANSSNDEWLKTLLTFGSVITEAAAICLAYQVDPQQYPRVLVLDGGASSLKGTILVATPQGLWRQEHCAKLETVNGPRLVEPLAQSVAQQFEQKHRFPRGEVWQSKKARAKLLAECEASLGSFQRLQNVAIHVDGLYEGMDCNVSVSKVKWEHLSSNLASQVKAFCKEELLHLEQGIDVVLVAGNMHDWMMPIIKSIPEVANKLHPATGSFDPSEAVAIGCTMQSYWNLQRQLQDNRASEGTAPPHHPLLPTLEVPCCPVSIGVENGGDDSKSIWIPQGTPLPCHVTHQVNTKNGVLELLQLHPNRKALAKLEELDTTASTTIQLQLTVQGRLRIQVNGGESIVIG